MRRSGLQPASPVKRKAEKQDVPAEPKKPKKAPAQTTLVARMQLLRSQLT